MTENKRFTDVNISYEESWIRLKDNGLFLIFPIHYTDKEEYGLPTLEDLLNELNDENEQLKSAYGEMEDYLARLEEENERLKQRNDRQYNQLKQLWELIEDKDYNTLRSMLNQRETDEKLLQKEWGTYSD